jgi:hypothetical protein
MIDRDHDLPVARQAQALNISRSSVYSKPRPTSAEDLKSCGGSTSCISIVPSREAGCCATCCTAKASRLAAAMSRR